MLKTNYAFNNVDELGLEEIEPAEGKGKYE